MADEPIVGSPMPDPREVPRDFYEQFKVELDKVTIKADDPAAAVVGMCIRAAKRAQMVLDGEHVAERIPRLGEDIDGPADG